MVPQGEDEEASASLDPPACTVHTVRFHYCTIKDKNSSCPRSLEILLHIPQDTNRYMGVGSLSQNLDQWASNTIVKSVIGITLESRLVQIVYRFGPLISVPLRSSLELLTLDFHLPIKSKLTVLPGQIEHSSKSNDCSDSSCRLRKSTTHNTRHVSINCIKEKVTINVKASSFSSDIHLFLHFFQQIRALSSDLQYS